MPAGYLLEPAQVRILWGAFRVFIRVLSGFYQVFIRFLSGFYQVFIRFLSGFYQVFIRFLVYLEGRCSLGIMQKTETLHLLRRAQVQRGELISRAGQAAEVYGGTLTLPGQQAVQVAIKVSER